jgi:uncharacterized protein (DUF4415 family)
LSDDDAKRLREELRRLEAMSDEDIDLTDMPEVTDFAGWERGKFYRPVKDQVTLRLDRDVLHWFKLSHERYQTAINQALREHIRRERAAKSDQ